MRTKHITTNKWSVLALTGLGVILSLMTWFSATSVTPELTAHFNLTASEVSWLTNTVQAGFVIGALLSSLLALADIVRPTLIMGLAALLAGAANGYILLEPSSSGILAARFVTGVALAGVYPPAMKFIATWFQKGRGLAMGSVVGALTLGSAMPHALSAAGVNISWQAVMQTSSFACIIAAAIFLFSLREGPFPFSRTKVDPRQIGAIIRNKPVMLANFGYFGHMWELYAMWGWFLAYATSANIDAGLPLNASILTFAVIALGAPSCVIAGLLADRYGRSEISALAMAISGTCALLIGVFFDGPLWAFILVACLWGFTVVSESAQFSASVSELAPSSLVGSALAFQMGVGFFITILVVWLVPHIAEWLGSWRWTFLLLVPGPLVGVIAMIKLRVLQKESAK